MRTQRLERAAISPLRTGALNLTCLLGTVARYAPTSLGAFQLPIIVFQMCVHEVQVCDLPGPRACTSNASSCASLDYRAQYPFRRTLSLLRE